jgi:hypothetical protein
MRRYLSLERPSESLQVCHLRERLALLLPAPHRPDRVPEREDPQHLEQLAELAVWRDSARRGSSRTEPSAGAQRSGASVALLPEHDVLAVVIVTGTET